MRRKKNTRQRAGTTHGYGSMKKHRGAGHRGGRGAAGSGKRGDAKKPSYWKEKRRFGKHGFTGMSPDLPAMNVGHLSSSSARLVEDGVATLEKGVVTVDLARLGIKRLLGGGGVTTPLAVTVAFATERAVKKVEAAGGSVNNGNA